MKSKRAYYVKESCRSWQYVLLRLQVEMGEACLIFQYKTVGKTGEVMECWKSVEALGSRHWASGKDDKEGAGFEV